MSLGVIVLSVSLNTWHATLPLDCKPAAKTQIRRQNENRIECRYRSGPPGSRPENHRTVVGIESQVSAGGCEISQTGNQHGSAESNCGDDERYRLCKKDGSGEGNGAANLQDRVALSATNSARITGTKERGYLSQTKRQKTERKSAAAPPPHSGLFQDHLTLETLLSFRIIRGLENAHCPANFAAVAATQNMNA